MQGWISNEYRQGLVSVVIPAYNREKFLPEAVQSVIEQDYRPIECIVVDDGSTDGTESVISNMAVFADEHFKIIYLKQENAGAQAARNFGTKACHGEFIQYLDSDDILYKNKISSQVFFLKQNSSCDGIFGDWDTGTKVKYRKNEAYEKEDMIMQMLTEKSICIFSFLMRRTIINVAGPWDTLIKRCQEIDFHLTVLMAGGKFNYQSINTGLWRMHEEERIYNKESFSSVIAFYNKWERILKEHGKWDEKFAKGVVSNYMWFLSAYPLSEKKQTMNLLREVKRLQPAHPIFNDWKFKALENIFGVKQTLFFWIKRYKKRMLRVNQ